MVLLSFVLNLFVAWLIFLSSNQIVRFMGRGGLKAVSKVFSLLLAAIAVSMIIRGLNLIGILHTAA
jgi:multiple antibiotic resistance protein